MTPINNINERTNLFKSLFKGREDVFAVRWEKGKKSGYIPAYHYDPYHYRLHKMKGGTFSNFNDKRFLQLTNDPIQKHLRGEQVIGVYPLLTDNTSWFIAADFDKKGWINDCRLFIAHCNQLKIPIYLERSRSGNGGHVWIFFEQPYPAFKSRRILKAMLEACGAFSMFDKTSSFDRLFPNQDFHSGKGIGNLIALPFNKLSMDQSNSCFIDPQTLIPFENQWIFLQQIIRVSTKELDQLYNHVHTNQEQYSKIIHDSLILTLNNALNINQSGLTPLLINFLKKEFNISNTEYFVKKKTNRSTWNTKRYFNLIEEIDGEIILPRGAVGTVVRFCIKNNIKFDFKDQRAKDKPIKFTDDIHLLKHQHLAVEACDKKDFGVIVAPPGSGKTIMGLKIIANKKQPALIIVHRKQLMDQWIERIEAFLKIPKSAIGKIGQGKAKIGQKITLAMIQTLGKKMDDSEISNVFKTIIIDECHYIPADSYSSTIAKLCPYYQYGLTATPFRKHNEGKLIFAHLGETIAEIKPQNIETYKRAKIVIKNTDFNIPFNSKTDQFEVLSKILIHDSARNKMIIDDISVELNKSKKVIVITERKEHITALNQFLKQTYEVITLSGEDSEKSRKLKWELLNDGNYQVLITTGQYFGEGSDLKNANCLFLVYPFSFKGKLVQYIGRVQRSEITPIIYDYRDQDIDYLDKLFLKRNKHYRHFDTQATLFDDPHEFQIDKQKNVITIDRKVKIRFEELDFRYGSVSFNYHHKPISKDIKFDIENDFIRPEFEILKPYFSKKISAKSININIFAEFQNNILVSQSATSTDLDKINKEIIESVRFSFVEQQFFGNKTPTSISNSEQYFTPSLYQSNEALLEDVLKNKNVKHFRQLRYLSNLHCSSLEKLRFVLNPFSFVFLLSGEHQYHIVFETLDTEEATYVWHLDNNLTSLKSNIDKVDIDLNNIRTDGRQVFLKNQPSNFSRIVHDYSDDRKGFILWKGLLEERLY